LTVKLEHLETLIERLQTYCESHITEDNLIKSVSVDTKIYENERNSHTLAKINKLAPFGEGNEEPIFLLENITIQKMEKVGNNGKSHLKIHGQFGNKNITIMFRGR